MWTILPFPLITRFNPGAMLDDIVVENMELQFRQRMRQKPSSATLPKHQPQDEIGVIAVAPETDLGQFLRIWDAKQ